MIYKENEQMDQHSTAFWHAIDTLVSESRIVIDRPKGSRHPKHPKLIYPVDYGYLEGTLSMDGGKSMDAFRAEVKKLLSQADPPSGGTKKYYRVQIGAYSMKANAETQLAKAKKAGFTDAFITFE